MNIIEMRSALSEENRKSGDIELPETMPSWAVRRAYELRKKLTLTPLPETAKRNLESFIRRTSAEINKISESERLRAQAKAQLATIQ